MSDKITNELILDEIRKSRQDVKATIQALDTRICLKIEEINYRVNKLEKENSKFEEVLEEIRRKEKENNIVIFGLEHTPNKISLEFIRNEFKRLLDVDIIETDINNYFPLGKEENCPIKVEFVSYLKKTVVLKSANKLKGTNISISNDMTIKERQENQILRKHLLLAKQNINNNCYIKQNKLYVNNQIYTVEQLINSEDTEENSDQTKSSSAPGTPVQERTNIKEPIKKLEKPPSKIQSQHSCATPKGITIDKEGKEVKQPKEMNNEKVRTRSTTTR